MIITYTSGGADRTITGNGWEAMRWVKSNDSLVIDHLWRIIGAYPNRTYEEVCKSLRDYYKTKTVRSSANLYDRNYQDKKIFEITTKGVFPKILITQD